MVLIALAAAAQDYVRLRNGKTIEGKVAEVGVTEIKYYKSEHSGNGPVYVVSKAEVAEILYQSGVTEKFNSSDPASNSQIGNPHVVVIEQPSRYYRRRPIISLHLGSRILPSRHHGIFRQHH